MGDANVWFKDQVDARTSTDRFQSCSVADLPTRECGKSRMLLPAASVDGQIQAALARSGCGPIQALLSIERVVEPLEKRRDQTKLPRGRVRGQSMLGLRLLQEAPDITGRMQTSAG